jgi:hypothetical protein
MPFRGTHSIRVILSAVVLITGLAAAAHADWEFSMPEHLGMDSASPRTHERKRGVSTLFLNPDGNFKPSEAISNAS